MKGCRKTLLFHRNKLVQASGLPLAYTESFFNIVYNVLVLFLVSTPSLLDDEYLELNKSVATSDVQPTDRYVMIV